jgi:hypothetical protein
MKPKRLMFHTQASCGAVPKRGGEVFKAENQLFGVVLEFTEQVYGHITQRYRPFRADGTAPMCVDINVTSGKHEKYVLQGVPENTFWDVSDAPENCTVPNVKQCPLCQGTVDRFDHHFQCRQCTAMGDTNTGIMTRCDLAYYEEMFGEKSDAPVVVG